METDLLCHVAPCWKLPALICSDIVELNHLSHMITDQPIQMLNLSPSAPADPPHPDAVVLSPRLWRPPSPCLTPLKSKSGIYLNS
ncbi:hypothetical protein PAMP_018524 [Pampus punctatissimus]